MKCTPLQALTLWFCLAAPCLAQDEIPIKVNNQNRTGDLPFSTSVGTDIEHVDMASGNLILNIPVISLKGRGMDFNFQFRYGALYWIAAKRVNIWGDYVQEWKIEDRKYLPYAVGGGLGWERNTARTTFGTQRVTCPLGGTTTWTTNWIYHDSHGGKHPLAVQTSSGGNCQRQDLQGPDLTGEGLWANIPSVGVVYPDIYLADGTRVFVQLSGPTGRLRDANGNFSGEGYDWTDTLGRTIVTLQSGTNQEIYTVYDSSGFPQTYTANYGTVNLATNFNVLSDYTGYIKEWTGSRTVITSIALPNGRSYQFQYESGTYGAITRIDLPTGGYITYTWATLVDGSKTHRYVASRTVNVDGQSYTWNFNRTGGGGSISVTVTDPLGNQSVYGAFKGAITSAQFYQGAVAGNPLRQHVVDYVSDIDPWDDYAHVDPNDPVPYEEQLVALRPIRITTTLDAGQVTKKEFDYETFTYSYHNLHDYPGYLTPGTFSTSRGNVTAIREYHYGAGAPGALARQTILSYLHNSNSAYLPYNIVNKVVTRTISDGAGAQQAQTRFEYDNYVAGDNPLTATSGTPQHDDTNYSTSFTTRGNVTQVKRWRNTDAALLTTTYTYDDLGSIRGIKDPLGHTTNYSYTDNWANAACSPPSNSLAFATQITNHLGQLIQLSYLPCTGLTQSRKDENDILAGRTGMTFAYDVFGRFLSKALPDGGQTTTAYNDTPPVSVTATTKITSALNLVATSLMDGLGRMKQTQLNSDPQGVVYADTTYDGLGRKTTVSNPYRSTSDPTYGITSYQYDALGRVALLIPPDGSQTSNNVSTAYSGNCTTVTDQAGKTRKSCADALGRLIQVFEPDANGNLVNETDYQYDVLDNLTCVEQHGGVTGTGCSSPPASDVTSPWRVRRFSYNSLSQLLSASNPESGAISYTYDADGNLLTKTAPARNQTGTATVTTTYAYDALHRLTQKSFSDTTPTVKYGYDGVAPAGCTPPALAITNGIGRRTSMCDAAGAEAWAYDAMGWPLTDQRTTNGVTKATTYTYNLDGSIATLTYPSGRTIRYTSNAAGRPVSAVDTTNAASPINYALAASYAPQGALASLALGSSGSFAGVNLNQAYNSRQQPTSIRAWSTNATTPVALDLSYSFNLGTANNGNVTAITNNRDTARSQSFTYDSLNRIATAQTTATTGTKCWGETFSYDIWANLLSIGGLSGYTGCTQENLNVSVTANNQISGFTYDAAGNLRATPPPVPASYTYNAENQLTSTAGVTYTYDGNGKRVQKSTGKLYWYGMGSDVLDESDAAGNITDEYVFFGGKRTARRHVNATPPDTVTYYFADHLGTSRVVTDASGTVLDDSDFYPFGGERAAVSSSANTYKFTGKERDNESGLDDFEARYYSSAMGRFMSPDEFAGGPIDAVGPADPLPPGPLPYAQISNPQSLNKYAYTYNNPLRYTDPNGHCIWDGCVVEIVAAAVVVGGIAYGLYKVSKKVGEGMKESSEYRKAKQESLEAAGQGDVEKAEQKDEEATGHAKKALAKAAEAGIEGMQIPGTSTGGDIGFGVPDAVRGVATGLAVDAQKRELERKRQQKEAQEQKRREEEQRRKQEEERRKKCQTGKANCGS